MSKSNVVRVAMQSAGEMSAHEKMVKALVAAAATGLLILATAAGVARGAEPGPKAPDAAAEAQPAAQAVTITVKGMHCGGCQKRIQSALSKLDGVKSVAVDLKGEKADVSYEAAKVTPETLVQEIIKLGYKASLPAKG